MPALFLGVVLSCEFCAGAAPQEKAADEKLLSALRDADLHAAKALLSGGASVNAKDADGLTALMYAAMYGRVESVELLLAQGAAPNARSNADLTALMLAISDEKKVRALLLKGAEVGAKTKQGHTALSIAVARAAPVDVVRILLEKGADLHGSNLLAVAARTGNLETARVLLEKGANPNDKTNIQASPVVSAKRASEQSNPAATPLRKPIAGLPVNIGGTPLMFAAVNRNLEMMKLLLDSGADIHLKTASGSGALIYAAQTGDLRTVVLLLEKGAEVNVKTVLGYTALMFAASAESNDPEVIKALLAKGAEVDVKGSDGETALSLALQKGRTEIVRMLEKASEKKSPPPAGK
jgi:ankyrin repeat protein